MKGIFKKLFGVQRKPVDKGGYTVTEHDNGDKLCELYSPVRAMCLLRPCEHTSEVYYFVNAHELPQRRYLALLGALRDAKLNYTPEELGDALQEVIESAHKQKTVSKCRIEIQNRIEIIMQRSAGNVQRRFLEEIALIFMVLKHENPFMYTDAYHDRKRGILNAEMYVQDFFLSIARQALAS